MLIELLTQLRKADIRLSVSDEELICDAPQGALTPDLRESIASNKHEIIRFLQDANLSAEKTLTAIKPVSRSQTLPISFQQKSLLYLRQTQEAGATYNEPRAFSLRGKLDLNCLERALNKIIERHEIFRTAYQVSNDEYSQVILEALPLEIKILELDEICLQGNDEMLQTVVREEADKPFHLDDVPLMRVTLFRLSGNENILLINTHHIAFDGWSMGVLQRELSQIYNAFIKNTPDDLIPLPIQYADFASWQQSPHREPFLRKQLVYWEEKLRGAPTQLELLTDKQRPQQQSFRGASYSCVIPAFIHNQIKTLARKEKVTEFVILLSTFYILLYRHTGQEDLLLGSPTANRAGSLELEDMIGCFINLVVLRAKISSSSSFKELLHQVQQISAEAFAHQDIPLEKLVTELKPERDPSINPFFQVLFTLQNASNVSLNLNGLEVSRYRLKATTAKFDISLSIEEFEDGLFAIFEYNTDLFYESTIHRIADHYLNLLSSVIDNPAESLSKLSMLGQTDYKKVISQFNNTKVAYPNTKCFHELFEALVQVDPDKICVVFNEEKLSYRELDQKANQLAHYLNQKGAKPGNLVALCINRSLDMLIALIGIHKAGCAYIPMDPLFPLRRLEYMLEDAEPTLIITEGEYLSLFDKNASSIICIDEDNEEIAKSPTCKLRISIAFENLAYIIFTSGSTGRPKGVQVSHLSLANFLLSMQKQPGIKNIDVCLAITTISFDIAALELYLPLITGATVVIASNDIATNSFALMDTIEASNISFMQATPATWRMLVDSGWQGQKRLKLLTGGEALPHNLSQDLLRRCGQLWNMYGPTETTVWSSLYRCQENDDKVFIGHPIANTQLYILDKHLQPVSIGVAGELYIGGDGLALGYVKRDELTRERFVPNPFSKRSRHLLYRTGDLARFSESGNIEHLGRIDNQVKVRGFRIELDEIQSALESHPNIPQAVVVIREDVANDKRIVAYVVNKVDGNNEVNCYKNFLSEILPSYMVPTSYEVLSEMPLTPNGKVDRKSLPKPTPQKPHDVKNDMKPTHKIEVGMAIIWSDLLQVDDISLNDNFFELGGHSLLSVQAVHRIQEELSLEVSPRDFILLTLGQIAGKFIPKHQKIVLTTNGYLENPLKPYYITNGNKKLFACYHCPSQYDAQNMAVLLCYPVGQEHIRTHRTFKLLSEELAALGFSVLRFDYFGCGDSEGDFEDASVAQWQSDIQCATEELKKISGKKRNLSHWLSLRSHTRNIFQ